MTDKLCSIGLRVVAIVATLCLSWIDIAVAQSADRPATFIADDALYDEELGTVTATGNVEVLQGERVLRADKVIYNERVDTVTASGNVTLLEPDGKVLFADYMELFDNFKNGIIASFKMLFQDNSRIAASSASRFDGNVIKARNAVYSPCDLCPKNPNSPPLWQLRGIRVNHDQEAQTITFKDMFLELKGVPVAYFPFFAVPDPTVQKQSGFLTPSFSYSGTLGFSGQQSYYQVLTPSADFTVSAIGYTKVAPVVTAEYRQRVSNGEFYIDGSGTRTDRPDAQSNSDNNSNSLETRGHVRSEGRFNLNPEWRAGFDAFRSSDDTYLRRYGISRLDTLTSAAYVEGFRNRSYAGITNYAFQDLRPNVRDGRVPYVLPEVAYSYLTQPFGSYGYGQLDAGYLNTYRTNGLDTRRLSSTASWHVPYTSSFGEVINVTGLVRGDFYSVDAGLNPEGIRGDHEGGTAHRVKPALGVDWRYPLAQSFGTIRHVIEPIVSLVAAPYGGNGSDIPNEDSRNLELDDTNIFAINRFPGRDRYDGGPRIGYGGRTAFYGATGGYTELLVAQSYRTKRNNIFPEDSGLERKRSDYVGRLVISPSSFIDIIDRVRVDSDDNALRRHEVQLTLGPSFLKFSAIYSELDPGDSDTPFNINNSLSTTSSLGHQEYVTLFTAAQLTRFWRVTGGVQRDIVRDFNQAYSGAFGYLDECFQLDFQATRINTRDRDVPPSYYFGLQFKLRNLG